MILLVGKFGSGKDFLVKLFGLTPVVSRTTRPPRENEINNVHKIFVSEEAFEKYFEQDIIAYTYFEGYRYCALPKDLVGKNVYIIDPRGVRFIKRKTKDSFNKEYMVVYVKSSLYRRFCRLYVRDGFKKAVKRIKHDYFLFRKFEKKKNYNVLLRN